MNGSCWSCPECLGTVNGNLCEKPTEEDGRVKGNLEFQDIYEFDMGHTLHHMTKALGYHSSYLQGFLEAYTCLLHENGPLPFNYRSYIGIMAVSRHQCCYLVDLLSNEFTANQGDLGWLMGLDHAPEKLRNLDEINKLLAHRPWLLDSTHILKLTKGGRENWSISELTQGIVLLVFYHCLASLVASCGVEEGNRPSPVGLEDSNNSSLRQQQLQRSTSEVYGIDALLERMRLVQADASDDFTPEERLARFNLIERQSVGLLEAKRKRKTSTCGFSPFTKDTEFTYEDFATQMGKMEDLQPFPLQEYSWETHGYLVANMYYTESAMVLDNKFRIAKSLTYNTVGTHPNVDTRTFRTAVWNYTQCMLGLMHDDYDYEVINTLLEKNLRSYIKAVTCFPETVTRTAYEGFMKDLLPSEKVHINIMMHEARLQAEVLYGFRAITKYMTTDW